MKTFITKVAFVAMVITILVLLFLVLRKHENTSQVSLVETQDPEEVVSSDTQDTNNSGEKVPVHTTGTLSSQTSLKIATTTSTGARVPISAEERKNCMNWQVAWNRAGKTPAIAVDGICQDKSYTQEYLATKDQVVSQSSQPTPTPQPTTQHYEMQTYTSAKFGFSFKYPEGMICEQSAPKYPDSYSSNGYTSTYIPDADYLYYSVSCGNKNINGGKADSAGGAVYIYEDKGSSRLRSDFRDSATESKTKIVGGNKFYQAIGKWALEKPNYLFAVSDLDRLIAPSHIDLASLKF